MAGNTVRWMAGTLAALVGLASPAMARDRGNGNVERLPESDTLASDEYRAPLERARRAQPSRTDRRDSPRRSDPVRARSGRVAQPPAVDTKPVTESTDRTSVDEVLYVGTDPTTFPQLNLDAMTSGGLSACGTSCLSMILAHLGLIEATREAGRLVDQAIRPWGGFSAPRDLRDYAAERGLQSSAFNGASFAQLKRALGNGTSVMALIDGGGGPRWVVILGVETSIETGAETLVVASPGDRRVERLSRAVFERMWDAPLMGATGGFLGDTLGYHDYFMAFDRNADRLPFGRTWGLTSAENLADGVTDITSSLGQLADGQLVTAATSFAGGAIKAVTALPGLLGNVLETAGDGALGWAGERSTEGGFFNSLGAIGGYALGLPLKAGGAVLGAVGTVVSAVGGVVGGVVKGVGRALGNAFRSIF